MEIWNEDVTKKEVTSNNILEDVKKWVVASALALWLFWLNPNNAQADEVVKNTTVPVDFIEEWTSVDIPKTAVKYNSNGIEYVIWKKTDNTFAMKIIKTDDEHWSDFTYFKFNFKGNNYILEFKIPNNILEEWKIYATKI